MCSKIATIFEAVKWGQNKLEQSNIENPRLEAELLLAYIMGYNRGEIYLNFPLSILQEQIMAYQTIIEKRCGHYPWQYITGNQEFMSLQFSVTPDVLIPRQDTEILVEKVISLAKMFKGPRIIDIGTGSGAIAISLAKYVPNSIVYAVDVSKAALAVAEKNAHLNGVAINFLEGDMFTALDEEKFDIIVSNPPYISSNDIAELMPEVKFEPLQALDGGKDGLWFYRQIVAESPKYLNQQGFVALEIGFEQAEDINNLLVNQGSYQEIKLYQDFGGRDRVIVAGLK